MRSRSARFLNKRQPRSTFEQRKLKPTAVDALNAGYGYLEVKCLGCNTHQTVALDIVRRPKTTPVHELERYMRCKYCSQIRSYAYKRSHLLALRPTKISANIRPRRGGRANGDRRTHVS